MLILLNYKKTHNSSLAGCFSLPGEDTLTTTSWEIPAMVPHLRPCEVEELLTVGNVMGSLIWFQYFKSTLQTEHFLQEGLKLEVGNSSV